MSKAKIENPTSKRYQLLKRDGKHCWICGHEMVLDVKYAGHDWYISIDHFVPKADGGTHELANLRLAHRWCNSARREYGLILSPGRGVKSPNTRWDGEWLTLLDATRLADAYVIDD